MTIPSAKKPNSITFGTLQNINIHTNGYKEKPISRTWHTLPSSCDLVRPSTRLITKSSVSYKRYRALLNKG